MISINVQNRGKYNEICNLLEDNDINFTSSTNVYQAVCQEEIEQAIDASNVLDDESFYDLTGNDADAIIIDLVEELYLYQSEYAFQRLAEIAQDLVDDTLQFIKNRKKIRGPLFDPNYELDDDHPEGF